MDKDNEIDLIQTIQKKDKVIDEMINFMFDLSKRMPGSVFKVLREKGFNDSLCDHCGETNPEKKCSDCIKQYFYKKVEDKNNE